MARVLRVNTKADTEGGRYSPWRRMRRRKRERVGAWGTVLFVFLILVVSVSPNFFRKAEVPDPGTIWYQPDIISPYTFRVSDESTAEMHRRQVEARHEKVFVYNGSQEVESQQKLKRLLELAERERGSDGASRLQNLVSQELGLNLQAQTVRELLARVGEDRFRSDLKTILHHFYVVRMMSTDKALLETAAHAGRLAISITGNKSDARITTPTLEGVLGYPGETFAYLDSRYLPTFAVSQDQQLVYSDITRQLLRPNIIHDRERTRAHMITAMESLKPVRTVTAGERIIARGAEVGTYQVAALKKLSSEIRYYNGLRAAGAAIAAALAILFVMLYVRRFNPELEFNTRSILLVALPVVLAISLGRFLLNLGGAPLLGAFAFPAGMVGMLGVILFDARFALVLVTIGCTLFGISVGLNYPYTLIGLVGGYTAVASLYTMKERREVLMTGFRIALANCATAVAVELILRPDTLDTRMLASGIANGLFCYGLTVAALPLFEALFRVTTDVRLMELTSMHHPLLMEMEAKAPGSFQHSLNVAKLAESAADAVDARYLLVRAGAYFHDVGKMVKPKYYTENQVTPEERRIHSKLSPYMSNLIIKNHVKDGVELAKKHHLPEKVLDFIPQHHGTGLIKYFYAQALKKAEGVDIVHEDEFRYPGPKPQSIEAAIVMLADTVEATATAKFTGATLDEDDLRKMVRDSILDKFNDGQFDECHMTFRDLHHISEAFVRSLQSRFHQRVNYPEMPRRDVRDVPRADRSAGPVAATPRGQAL